jgi:hypothetical protein
MKALIIKCVRLVAIILLPTVQSNAEQWRGITPLKSTRAEVERLLGKPVSGGMNFLAIYKLETGEVHIHYAISGLCKELERCECLVPDDTVIEVSVESKVKVKFSTLNIDKTAFDRFPLAEDTNIMIYRNPEAGLVYAVSKRDDKIMYIQYAPAAKDCERVVNRLKTSVAGQPRIDCAATFYWSGSLIRSHAW